MQAFLTCSRTICCAAGILGLAVMIGCGGRPVADSAPPEGQAPSANAEAASADVAEPAVSETDAESIELLPISYEGLQDFLQKNRGHAIVLDVWSTSCEPCIKELPNLVQLVEDHAKQGLVGVTLNIDYTGAAETAPRDAKEQALPVLQALDIGVVNFYSTLADEELFRRGLFKENHVYAIPAIFVVDRSGKVVGTFGEPVEGESPYQAVRSEVEKILGSS